MAKSLTAEDLTKLKKIVDDINAIIQTENQLKSLSEGPEFVNKALDILGEKKASLYKKGNELIDSFK